jgi:hypothetical protein
MKKVILVLAIFASPMLAHADPISDNCADLLAETRDVLQVNLKIQNEGEAALRKESATLRQFASQLNQAVGRRIGSSTAKGVQKWAEGIETQANDLKSEIEFAQKQNMTILMKVSRCMQLRTP